MNTNFISNRFWFSIRWILFFLLTVKLISSQAQSIANYTFSASSGTYSAIYTSGTNLVCTGDENLTNSTSIGFDFWYMGTKYNYFGVSTNGFLTLGSGSTALSNPCATNNLTSSANGSRPALAPLWDDQYVSSTSSGDVYYKLTGTAPNRVLTVEWYRVYWNYNAASIGMDFQVKLYETSNKVEFIYNQQAGALNAASASIGITASGTGSGNFMSLNGSGASPTASTTSETTTISSKPANGQTYAFTPASVTAPSGLSFSSITGCGMTVSWTDNASGELGYVVYYSTNASVPIDGTSSTAVTLATNSTSTSISGLTPNTTYYFKVFAYKEGLSSALSGSQASGSPTTNTWTGATSTAWSTASNWSLGHVPTSCETPVIPNVTNDPIVSSTISLTDLTIQNGGVLRADAAITISGTFTIDNGGTYIHNNTGNPKTTIFAGTESFGASSTFEIRNWPGTSTATYPFPHNGSTTEGDAFHSSAFGNLVINWNRGAGADQWEWHGKMTLSSNPRIAGTLTITELGSNDIHMIHNGGESHQLNNLVINGSNAWLVFKAQDDGTTEGSSTLDITGDFTLSAGRFILEEDGEATAVLNKVRVAGTFTFTGGTIYTTVEESRDYNGITNELHLNGNVVLNGGTFTQTESGLTTWWHPIYFGKSGTQTYSENGTTTITNNRYYISSGSTVQLASNMKLSVIPSTGTEYDMIIVNGTLDAGNYVLYPSTNSSSDRSGIMINNGGRVKTTNTSGFYTVGSAATTIKDSYATIMNVTINSGGIVEYNGSSSQAISVGPCKDITGVAVSPARAYSILDINNSASGGSALTVASGFSTEQIYLRDGVVSTGANTITVLNTTAGSSGSVQQQNTGSYINTGTSGKLRRYVASSGSYDFPLGDADDYELANINLTSVSGGLTYLDGNFSVPGTNNPGTGLPLSENGGSYNTLLNNGTGSGTAAGIWDITPNGGTATYTATLYGRNYNNAGTVSHTVAKRYSSTATAYSDDFSSSTWSTITNTGSVNGWNITNSSCNISGNSLAIHNGTPCSYTLNDNCDKIAYHSVTGTGFSSMTLTFNWKCVGEESGGVYYDYGRVGYSTDGTTWTYFTTGGKYNDGYFLSQSSVTSQSFTLPAGLNNSTFYIGFRWVNDGSSGTSPGFVVDDISITGSYTGTNNWTLPGSYTSGSNSGGVVTASRTGITGFSQFAIVENSTFLLPVELADASVYCKSGNPELYWKTLSEVNNHYFTIERSTDGINFVAIKKVNGSGNSQKLNEYKYCDKEQMPSGTLYYRLSQTDLDGHTEVLKTLSLIPCGFSNLSSLSYMPNPVSKDFQLALTANEQSSAILRIYSLSGAILAATEVHVQQGANNISLSLANYPAGVYFVEVTDKVFGVRNTIKVVKQ